MGLGYGMDGIFVMDEIGRWMINDGRDTRHIWDGYIGWTGNLKWMDFFRMGGI
jgi:hypothetical protein